MKILVVNDISRASHSSRPEVEIYINWARLGHQVTVFSPAPAYREELESLGIDVLVSRQKHKISLSTIFQLRKLMRENDYDVVYATNSRTIPSAAFAAIGHRAKLVCYRGTISGLYRSDPTSYLTILHPRIDGVVCVSNAVTEYVQRKLLKSSVRAITIYKGHQLSWYNETPADLTEFGIPDNAFVAIAVARFRPRKGLSVLLDAMQYLAHLENFHLLVVGSGADSEPYTSQIKNSPMRSRIHVTGFRDNAPQFVAASNVLVQASTGGEGLPRAMVEALAYGVPAIATETGGAKEFIKNGENGYIVPVRDAKAIAEKIEYLYHHPEQHAAMREACRQTVRTALSSETTAREHIDFFYSLMGEDNSTLHFEITDAYAPHKAEILSLVSKFSESGTVLQQGRNTIKKIYLGDLPVVVKSFRNPGSLRGWIYANLVRSKAKKSFQHAQQLLANGIDTPEPIAWIEQVRNGRIESSFYLSLYAPHDMTMRDIFARNDQQATEIIQLFTRFTYAMHNAGILHLDHSANNTLITLTAEGYRFTVIDINRMKFGKVSIRAGLKNFVRLTDNVAAMETIARIYADCTSTDPDWCRSTLLALKKRHVNKLALKRTLKNLF